MEGQKGCLGRLRKPLFSCLLPPWGCPLRSGCTTRAHLALYFPPNQDLLSAIVTLYFQLGFVVGGFPDLLMFPIGAVGRVVLSSIGYHEGRRLGFQIQVAASLTDHGLG